MESINIVRDRCWKTRCDVFPCTTRIIRSVKLTRSISVWSLAHRSQQTIRIIGMHGYSATVIIGKALRPVRPRLTAIIAHKHRARRIRIHAVIVPGRCRHLVYIIVQIGRHGFPCLTPICRAHDITHVNIGINPAIRCPGKTAHIWRTTPGRVPFFAHRKLIKRLYAMRFAIVITINMGLPRTDKQAQGFFINNNQTFDILLNTRGNRLGTRLRTHKQIAIFQGNNAINLAFGKRGNIAL